MEPFDISAESISQARGATESMRTIRSLRDIPLVDSSLDFESIFSDKPLSHSCSSISSPKQTLRGMTSRGRFFQSGGVLDDPVLQSIPSGENITLELDNPQLPKDSIRGTVSSTSTPHRTRERDRIKLDDPPPVTMDEITRLSGEIASMTDYVGTWAPIAHHFVVTASAMQRDTAAFSTALGSLLTQQHVDLNSFVGRFYQLRSAYSTLLSIGDATAANSNFQNYAGTDSKSSRSTAHADNDLETTWEDRQMVDSFMTLLRTSPGFLTTAFIQMPMNDLRSFTSDEDCSPLNILFHGVMGSARRNRARIFAEIVLNAALEEDKRAIILDAVLKRFMNLAIGNFSPSTTLKFERYLRLVLKGRSVDFAPIFYSCLPDELSFFIGALLQDTALEIKPRSPEARPYDDTEAQTDASCGGGCEQDVIIEDSSDSRSREALHEHRPSMMQSKIAKCLEQYALSLISFPHLYNALLDTYLGERQKTCLQNSVGPSLELLVANTMRDVAERHKRSLGLVPTPLWAADELVVVKGSDIVQLYKTLLPTPNKRDSFLSNFSEPEDDDGWCLESIKADLVPVMLGISHSISKNDGWQVFKVGPDGLISDLATDLSVSVAEESNMSVSVKALCDAVSHFDGENIECRIESALQDALLRGDHATVFLLQRSPKGLTRLHLEQMQRQATVCKSQCKSLQEVVNLAVRDQRREQSRLSTLLDVLDHARIYIWYDYEVRPSVQYGKSRELLNQLYPPTHPEDRGADAVLEEVHQTMRSKRMSILSSHMAFDSPFYNRSALPIPKLTDKEVDVVITYMRKHKTRNIIRAEEKFHRGLVEIALLAKRLIDRDHMPNYVSFKRDKQFQAPHGENANAGTNGGTKRNSMHTHRRSSLGLFDLFDISYHYQTASPPPVSLHTTTSTQFLGLSRSQNSLRRSTSVGTDGRKDGTHAISLVPRGPALMHVQQLLLSDIGAAMVSKGTETDAFMSETGRMLLDGDSKGYEPLLDDLSLASSPDAKLVALERLLSYTRCVLQFSQPAGKAVTRTDVVRGLSKVLCREPGSIYGDLQTIATLVSQSILDKSQAFEDVSQASRIVLETVAKRCMEYASRILRYILETTAATAPKTASTGISDTVAMYAFCAKQGNVQAQRTLADLYTKFTHVKMEVKPLTRPSIVFQGHSNHRAAVAAHWRSLANATI